MKGKIAVKNEAVPMIICQDTQENSLIVTCVDGKLRWNQLSETMGPA